MIKLLKTQVGYCYKVRKIVTYWEKLEAEIIVRRHQEGILGDDLMLGTRMFTLRLIHWAKHLFLFFCVCKFSVSFFPRIVYQCGETITLYTLVVGKQNGTATLQTFLEVSYKIKYMLTIWLSNPIPSYLARRNVINTKTYTWKLHVCRDFILTKNLRKLISSWTDK